MSQTGTSKTEREALQDGTETIYVTSRLEAVPLTQRQEAELEEAGLRCTLGLDKLHMIRNK